MPDKKLTDNEIVKALECMLGIHNQDIEFSIDCRGCAFEDLNICTDRFSLLNDICVKTNIIYVESEITEVLNYENSISR